MAQQIINNGESGLSVRNKLNENFTEIYTGKDAVTVNTFADLPAASTVSGQRYWVLTTTGVYLVNRRQAGAYYSNGTTWTWLGDVPTTADQIGNVPAGAIASTNVQAAINELDSDLTGAINNLPTTIRSQVESALVAGANITITPSGSGPTRQFTIANSFGSQSENTFLAAPNGAAGAPTFRALVAADIPTLNQNTTGSAATLTTGRTIGMTGDVSWTSASFNGSGNVTGAATIQNDAVTNAKLANMATATIKGRTTAGTGDPEDLTATQATALLDTFTSTLNGLAPASGGGTANFLRADGAWAAPPGGGGSPSRIDVFTSSTSFAIDPACIAIHVICINGGGGGGSGRRGATTAGRAGGAGGQGGGWSDGVFNAAALPSRSLSVVVGAGGTGGSARTTNDTNGAGGNSGGSSSVSSAGNTVISGGSGGNGGSGGGTSFTSNSGTSFGVKFPSPVGSSGAIGGGSNGNTGVGTPSSGAGGGGAAASSTASANGGEGGGVFGFLPGGLQGTPGQSAGTRNAGAGGDALSLRAPLMFGGGGGSGAYLTGASGGAGGNGGLYGGGGGGGAASDNGFDSGAGGTGGSGLVAIIQYF